MSSKRNICVQELANTLDVHKDTLRREMKRLGLSKVFDTVSDAHLDQAIKHYKKAKPRSGIRYTIGFLRMHGLRIQRSRVMKSLRRVDGVGQILRRRQAIQRQKYSVPRPNYLWHCDGHHKLIWWGIVIHGFIDGYDRNVLLLFCPWESPFTETSSLQIVGLRASTNNKASTVLAVFLEATASYGVPSRLRGDRGGENVALSVYMILKRGPNRASFMWGSWVS